MGNEFVFPFEKLEVWQLAVDLAEYLLNALESLPQLIDRKPHGLINSLRSRT